MRWRPTVAVCCLAIITAPTSGRALTARLITGASLVNQTPGRDLRIGTGDDGTMSGPIPPNASGPNAHGAASFALLSPGPPTPDFSNFQYVLFVDGTIEFTPDWSASSTTSLVLRVDGGTLRTTPEFDYPSRGEATTAITSGIAEANLGTRSGSIGLTASFAAPSGAFPLNDEALTASPGFVTIVPRLMFGYSNDPYIDHILTPLVPPDATAIICVEFTGTVATPPHAGYQAHGVLAAYTSDDLGCAILFPDVCPPSRGSACATFAACASGVANALPTAAIAPSLKARRIAVQLQRLETKATHLYQHAPSRSGKKRTRLLGRARATLTHLLAVATAANARGTLAVPLDAISAAVTALLGQIPAA